MVLAQNRYAHILKLLEENSSVTVFDISEMLGVSTETVRRDLIHLETLGKLKRVFGGAVLIERHTHLESLQTRLDTNTALKAELAACAVSFIDNEDVIAMESGSTAIEMAKVLLKTDLHITVITYSNTVFNLLKSKFRVILIGGEYIPEDDCFGGFFAEEFLKKFHVNKAFVFPAALSPENGIESYILPTINLERIFVDIADKVFVAVDSEKFHARASFKAMDLSQNYVYITDSKVAPDIQKHFSQKGYLLFTGEKNVQIK